MDSQPVVGEPIRCANCDEAAGPNYCAHCGQRVEPRRGPVVDVAREMLSDWLSLDSRLLRSLGAIRRPGRLSELYLSGKRAPFLRPLRLYLIASLALFSTVLTLEAPRATEFDIYIGNELISSSTPDPSPESEAATVGSSVDGDSARVRRSLQLMKDNTLLDHWIVGLARERIDRLRDLPRQELVDIFFAGLRSMLPLTLILFVPFLALGLKLLYVRGRAEHTLYLDHLVFALHFQSALFFALVVGWLLNRMIGLELVVSALAYALLALAMLVIYLPIALRRFYQQSRRWTAVKTFVLLFVYFQLLSLAVDLSVLVGLRNV